MAHWFSPTGIERNYACKSITTGRELWISTNSCSLAWPACLLFQNRVRWPRLTRPQSLRSRAGADSDFIGIKKKGPADSRESAGQNFKGRGRANHLWRWQRTENRHLSRFCHPAVRFVQFCRRDKAAIKGKTTVNTGHV